MFLSLFYCYDYIFNSFKIIFFICLKKLVLMSFVNKDTNIYSRIRRGGCKCGPPVSPPLSQCCNWTGNMQNTDILTGKSIKNDRIVHITYIYVTYFFTFWLIPSRVPTEKHRRFGRKLFPGCPFWDNTLFYPGWGPAKEKDIFCWCNFARSSFLMVSECIIAGLLLFFTTDAQLIHSLTHILIKNTTRLNKIKTTDFKGKENKSPPYLWHPRTHATHKQRETCH